MDSHERHGVLEDVFVATKEQHSVNDMGRDKSTGKLSYRVV